MTEVTIEVSGPGSERAAVFAGQASQSALVATNASQAASGARDLALAGALTAPGVYPTVADGMAASADDTTFWAQTATGQPVLYRHSGATVEAISSLSSPIAMPLSSFGAIPDGKLLAGINATAGSTAITISDGGIFLDEHVGKTISIAGAGANGSRLTTTLASVQSSTAATLSNAAQANATGTGAVVGTDAGPALQLAFDAVGASLGGTILVDGIYVLRSGVESTVSIASEVRLLGIGGNSGFLIAVGAGKDAISLAGIGRLGIDHVNFAGCPAERDDARRVLWIRDSLVRVRDCGFYGIANNTELAAVIHCDTSELGLMDNVFGGCAVASGYNSSTVYCTRVAGFYAERNRQLDYGTFMGVYLSKTGISFSLAWMHLQDQFWMDANAVGQSTMRFVDNRYDEGHVYAVAIEASAGGNAFDRVFIDGMQANNTFINIGSALFIADVTEVEIYRTAIGWVNVARTGIQLHRCGTVVIDRIKITAGAPGDILGLADGLLAENVERLVLREAQAIRRLSLTNVGEVVRCDDQRGGVIPYSKLGRITDDDFDAPPPLDTIAYDRSAKRLYVRDVSGWLATPVLITSNDPAFVLNNVTPATGTVTGAARYTKTAGGDNWNNCTANLSEIVSGGFTMRISFPTLAVGRFARLGAVPASFGMDTVTNVNDVRLGVLLNNGSTIYLISDATLVAGPFPYTAGQEIELVYDGAAGKVTMKCAGATLVNAIAAPATLRADLKIRFSSSLYSVGTVYDLLGFDMPA